MNILFPILAGLVCGIVSGFGIGGGSLLMVYMTAIALVEQRAAQGINLLYFLPTAAAALLLHAKNRFVRWHMVLPAAASGCLLGALCAWLSAGIDSGILRKIFGVFLLFVGLMELFRKKSPNTNSK